MLDIINDRFGTNYSWENLRERFDPWHKKISSIPEAQLSYAFREVGATPYAYVKMEPHADADLELLQQGMQEAAFLGYFLSARLQPIHGTVTDPTFLTKMWLEKHGVTDFTGIFTRLHTDLESVSRLLHLDAVVTDCPRRWAVTARGNHRTYLIDRPWNREIDTDKRVFSISEFLLKVLAPEERMFSDVAEDNVLSMPIA